MAEHFVSAEHDVEVMVVVSLPTTFIVEKTVHADAVAASQDDVELEVEEVEVSSLSSFSSFGSS